MKRLIYLLFTATLFSVSCKHKSELGEVIIVEYIGYSYFVWINESDHVIFLSGARNGPTHDFTDKVIQPGESLEKTGIGFVSPPIPVQYSPVMTVVFDDGAYQATYDYHDQPIPEGYNIKYDLTWTENYVREEVDSPNGCEPCLGARWTYTFTNADYEAAVRMSEAQGE